jgi:hypothetical protein
MSTRPSRRRLLQAALAAPLAACTSTPRRRAAVDPDVALRAAAVAREQQLLARYATATSAALVAIRTEHEQHLQVLGGATASASPALPSTSAQLVAAEHAAAAGHAADALRASGGLAALLASLAASEASHQVALA